MIIYIPKSDTWFDEGTIVKLVDDYREDMENCGLFEGLSDGMLDEEICSFDEFELIENPKCIFCSNYLQESEEYTLSEYKINLAPANYTYRVFLCGFCKTILRNERNELNDAIGE